MSITFHGPPANCNTYYIAVSGRPLFCPHIYPELFLKIVFPRDSGSLKYYLKFWTIKWHRQRATAVNLLISILSIEKR